MYFISHLILMKDFNCFAESDRQYFWRVACKIKLVRTNWNRKGQVLSHFFTREIYMSPKINNLAVSGSFSRRLFITKKAKLQNAMQGSSWKSGFPETIDWNCFVFSLDASVGWCKVQQLKSSVQKRPKWRFWTTLHKTSKLSTFLQCYSGQMNRVM